MGLMSFLTFPFIVLWNISKTLSFTLVAVLSPLFLLKPQRQLSNEENAIQFHSNFEKEYGIQHVPFFRGGFQAALKVAKQELRYLIVVLQSDRHDETPIFNRQVLCSPELISFIEQHNILLWMVALKLQCTRFPFLALVAYHSSSSSNPMAVLARIEGLVSPVQVTDAITSAMAINSSTMEALRAKRIEEQTARQIRQGQDSAYHASLARDRERTRRIAQERERAIREAQVAAENQRQEEITHKKLEQWRRYRVKEFLKEPTGPDTTKINFRLHSGQRIVRHFNCNSSIEELYAFIECHDLLSKENCSSFANIQHPENYLHEYKFRLISPFPRKILEPEMTGTLDSYRELSPNGSLLVESMEDII